MDILVRLHEIAENVEVILLGLAQRLLVDEGVDDLGRRVEIGFTADQAQGEAADKRQVTDLPLSVDSGEHVRGLCASA